MNWLTRTAGTWALPYTTVKADQLGGFLTFLHDTATYSIDFIKHNLYPLLGDDALFDEIDRHKLKITGGQVKGYVRKYLAEVLNQYERSPKGFKHKFEEGSLLILDAIIKEVK